MTDIDAKAEDLAAECEQVVAGFAELAARVHDTRPLCLVADLVCWCPDDPGDALAADGRSFFARTLRAFRERHPDDTPEAARVQHAVRLLTALPPARRAVVEAVVAGVARGMSLARY